MRKKRIQKNKPITPEPIGPGLFAKMKVYTEITEAIKKQNEEQFGPDRVTEMFRHNAEEKLKDLKLRKKIESEVITETKTEVIEIPILDLKLITKRFLSNEYHLTDEQLRSVEFSYMIRGGKFSGIKCEYKKG